MENITMQENEINEKLDLAIEEENKENKLEDSEKITEELKKDDDFIFNKENYVNKNTEEIIQDLEKAQRAAHNKQKIIGRQGAEVHQARILQQKVEVLQEELKKIKESEIDYYDDENTFINNKIKEKQIIDEINNVKLTNQILINKNIVISQIPEFDQLQDEIIKIAREDGLPEQNIMVFKQNPYNDNPQVLISFAKRAKDRIKTRDAESKIKELEGKPRKILKNIESVSNSQPIINSNFVSDRKISSFDTDNLSLDQINVLLDQQYKKEWGG